MEKEKKVWVAPQATEIEVNGGHWYHGEEVSAQSLRGLTS